MVIMMMMMVVVVVLINRLLFLLVTPIKSQKIYLKRKGEKKEKAAPVPGEKKRWEAMNGYVYYFVVFGVDTHQFTLL